MTNEEQYIIDVMYGTAGDFKMALWRAICQADEGNLSKLGLGFPVEVNAYRRYTTEQGWSEMVTRKWRER